jgi:hypothetical protein
MAVRITCINKDNGNHEDPHLAIQYLGWTDGSQSNKSTRLELVDFIEKGGQAYVSDSQGTAWLIVRTSRFGNKFVKTIADGRESDNLLHLPECK